MITTINLRRIIGYPLGPKYSVCHCRINDRRRFELSFYLTALGFYYFLEPRPLTKLKGKR